MSSKVKIPTLHHDNYNVWRAVACAAINALNGQSFIEKENDATKLLDAQRSMYWEIVAALTASVSHDLLHVIASETAQPHKASPYRIWRAIENHFNPLNASSVYKLKVEFHENGT